jgi:lipid-A-disaccharide synthase
MNIYIIAGEASGDAMGAKLMTEMRGVKFSGVGGLKMQELGLKSLFDYSEIALMGFLEILPHIFRLRKLIQDTASDIMAKKPDVLVTIDSPGFTYRVAKIVKKTCPDMKMIHMVAPSVWAYKPGRAVKYAAIYDHILTLLPFEPPYFEAVGLAATFIGHPVFEQKFGGGDAFRQRYGISPDAKVIVVTPGSRKGEIARHMPVFLGALDGAREKYPELVVVFVCASLGLDAMASEVLRDTRIKAEGGICVDNNERLEAYAAADVALAKSGTNTLEIAASLTPMIVGYKLNFFTFWLVKLMAKIKYASLINIMGGREIIPEFLQHKCTAQNLTAGLLKILDDPKIGQDQVAESMKALQEMGFGSKVSPSKEAARVIGGVGACLPRA